MKGESCEKEIRKLFGVCRINIINAFKGEEAEKLYQKLTVKKEDV